MKKSSAGLLIISVLAFSIAVYLTDKFPFFNNNISSAEVRCRECSLIMIAVDPLREDKIHAVRDGDSITPNIDRLANDSIVFTNFNSVSSWTLPAAMSLITGLYPGNHKIINKIHLTDGGQEETASLKLLSPDAKTLAQLLKEKG